LNEERAPSLRPARTKRFKKDLERCKRREYEADRARVVMGRLIQGQRLATKHRDHSLKGE